MLTVVSVLGFIGFLLLGGYLLRYSPWTKQDWLSLPTKSEYRALHPSLSEDDVCYQCHSKNVFDFGGLNPGMSNRKVICVQCKTALWREEF